MILLEGVSKELGRFGCEKKQFFKQKTKMNLWWEMKRDWVAYSGRHGYGRLARRGLPRVVANTELVPPMWAHFRFPEICNFQMPVPVALRVFNIFSIKLQFCKDLIDISPNPLSNLENTKTSQSYRHLTSVRFSILTWGALAPVVITTLGMVI